MAGETGCPCGAHINPAYQAVDYITQALVDLIVDSATKRLKFGPFIASILGIPIDTLSICDLPRPPKPADFELTDFVAFFPLGQAKFAQWLAYKAYEFVCECDDCPPITSCNQGSYSLVVTPGMGYLAENEVQLRYHLAPGADLWVERSDGQCLGNKNGVWIYWNFSDDTLADMTSVNVRDGNDGAPGDTWDPDALGSGVTLWFGGTQVPVTEPWPTAPDGVADFPGPPACSTSDICTALDYVYDTVRSIYFVAQGIFGPNGGLSTQISATMPGIAGAITGTVFDALPRLIAAAAPIQPSQLISETTVSLPASGLVDVSTVAYARLDPYVVPVTVGSRGITATEVYYSNHRTPGPGWVVCAGQDGVLWHRDLLYPAGLEFPVPSTATDLAVHLSPGVAISVTTWGRQV